MRQFEKEFEEKLATVDSDAQAAAVCGYMGATIHLMAGGYPDIVDRLNQHAYFWNTTLAALQSSAFVSLGRLFDTTRGNHTLTNLLTHAQKYPGIFSRSALEARKIKEGVAPDVAREYVSSAFEPTKASFRGLAARLNDLSQFYQSRVAPIRNKIFAHSAGLSRQQRASLFTEVMVRDLEEILVFPLQLYDCLWSLYHNGREPKLRDVDKLIAEILSGRASGARLEHVYATEETASFLRRFRLVESD